MRYNSTRGGVTGASFEEALFTGYTIDGGIFLPEVIPKVSKEQLESWKDLGFADLAKQILALFISEEEISHSDLADLLDKAYQAFPVPDIAPVKRLRDELNILELFHGRTWAFKDYALSVVGQLYEFFCTRRRKHYTVIVGTSGDTGSAAIEAVRGFKWVDIIVLLPRGRCTKLQELQMTTAVEKNVHVYRVDGTSDDIDVVIKPCFLDDDFRQKNNLTSINSINWARIMVQIVHYFFAYFRMASAMDETVEIVIPTGACGNITSGCIARQMGLPVRLVAAVTCNDIVARAISRGDFTMAQTVVPTLAPAMDIQIPYNMERIWDIFSGGDTELVKRLMEEFEEKGSVKVPETLAQKISEAIVETYTATDDIVKATMARVWADNSYVLCPHTAIAAAYHLNTPLKAGMNRICIATASPIKFREAVVAAGIQTEVDDRIVALENMRTEFADMEKGEDWAKLLRQKIVSVNETL